MAFSVILHLLLAYRFEEDAERQGKEAETIPPGPLYDAVKVHLTDAAILMVAEQNVNETSSLGRSALSIACAKGSAEVVDVFMKKGADVTVTDNDGCIQHQARATLRWPSCFFFFLYLTPRGMSIPGLPKGMGPARDYLYYFLVIT
ncbi:hypothetical protein EDB80DRAFT_687420 [Ilyonectria destructans]|nr:hypothetical protein EDB80DRAFT_687420 [Ilyonectria destructans]